MKIGILGTGHVGRALAIGWAGGSHDVVLGSRRPEDAASRAELATVREAGVPVLDPYSAVAGADVVVNATPGTVSVPLLTEIGAPALAGKALLDVAVGFREDGTLSHLEESLGEEIQRTFPDTKVVKTLCTIDAQLMVAPESLRGPSTVFLSGDDADAKRRVGGLLNDLGWPPDSLLDLGGIPTARGQEHYSLLFMGIADAIGSYGFGIQVVPPSRG
ncbi:NAD(P)-binding domain-containing protein [Spongiactinospora sp. TRM90649]|uniref:NADPH-dependent F420 reductase n=1 Tax=Spongiactinospora sp. TRM90649 TaxID=3031114 RepID=UPI0023F69F64|nr:NAD(P)-binding domain-containing protein [Spongiactinospora sp. TRM90649]MDF5751875.1 NAD(P)-binding domain-containing protein [Spongiactinospora sp. TRM90649]